MQISSGTDVQIVPVNRQTRQNRICRSAKPDETGFVEVHGFESSRPEIPELDGVLLDVEPEELALFRGIGEPGNCFSLRIFHVVKFENLKNNLK